MDDDDDIPVTIHLGKRDALNVAAFLEAYGDEADENIAANIRYEVKQAEEAVKGDQASG